MALSHFGRHPSPVSAAGILSLALIFSSLTTVSRIHLTESEGGTLIFLQTLFTPGQIYWGKLLWSFLQNSFFSLLMGITYLGILSFEAICIPLFLASLIGISLNLSVLISITSQIIMAANLSAASVALISLPLITPLVIMGMGALKGALGNGNFYTGWTNVIGLGGIFLLMLTASSLLIEQIWDTVNL